MKGFQAALWMEVLKVRKSKIFWGSVLFVVFVSCMIGLLMFVQMYPEISVKLGMIGNKASFLRFGEPNWQNFFNLLIQTFSGVGIIVTGFVASWVFGREFSERTLKDILVVPVSRTAIIFAKSLVVAGWSFILALFYFVSSLFIGQFIGLPGLSGSTILHNGNVFLITTLLIIPLFTPVAFLASYSRGYILPLGFVILSVILANFSGLVGLGPYFPWAIPGLYGIVSEDTMLQLNTASYFVVIITCFFGLYGTIAFWQYSDQK